MQWQQSEFVITDQHQRLDIDFIHNFLCNSSYWAKGIPRAVVEKSLTHSLGFGLFHHEQQIGFGRVVSDYATFAYLADVFVLESYRGQGLGKWLVACILEHPELQGLRGWFLRTADAHGLYQQFGFSALSRPERCMEILHLLPYQG